MSAFWALPKLMRQIRAGNHVFRHMSHISQPLEGGERGMGGQAKGTNPTHAQECKSFLIQ